MEETKNINDQSNLNTPSTEGDVTASPVQPDPPEKTEAPQPETTAGLEEKIEIKQEPPTPEKLELEIATVNNRIVELIGIRASVRVKVQEDGSFYVNLRSRNSDGLLIGKRGMTIVSIQALVNQIMKHRYPTLYIDIFVDVSGYRKRRESFLKKKALAVARIVIDTNREMALDMLTEREFRMVEKEVIPLGTVRIYGVGSGSKRTVVIAPL
jgi:spoIIIJ-associated protein